MSVSVNCSTYSNFYNYNPVSYTGPTNGSWKYFYFVCGSYNTTYTFNTFPNNTTIYLTVAAAGGKGLSEAGGGGGNIVTFLVNSAQKDSIEVELYPIGYDGTINIFTPADKPTTAYFLNTGLAATYAGTEAVVYDQDGGWGASVPENYPQSTIHTTGYGGLGQINNGYPFVPNPPDTSISINFSDGTIGSVVSSGGYGQSGNSCWLMLYYKFNYENS